jgi:hypothetical protein
LEDDFWIVKHKHRPYTQKDMVKLKRWGTYVDYNVQVDRPKSKKDPSQL